MAYNQIFHKKTALKITSKNERFPKNEKFSG